MISERQQQRRESYLRNRERELAQHREWVAANKERRTEYMQPYLAEYYKANKPQIRQQMADKYKTDPEFRKKILADSKTRDAKIKAGHVPKPPLLHRDTDGTTERLYRMSEAAREVGCCNTAFNRWHDEGWVPEPLIVDGRRLYTQTQTDLIALFYSVNCHNFEKRSEVSKIIFEEW